MSALHDIVLKGATDRSVTVRIIDSSDGTPETAVVFNTSGIDLWYRREGEAKTSITEATLASLTTAHADGGFLHVSDGVYRLDLPDAAFATSANYVDFGGTVTGMIVIGGRVRLVNVNNEDSVRMGLTALPNAAAEASGGLYTRGTGAGQVNQPTNGQIDANVAAFTAGAITSAAFATTAGSFPHYGISDQGTAQSATSSTLVLRSAAAFADNELAAQTIYIVSATAGAGQSRIIASNVGSTDTATLTSNWTTTPTGTIVYKIFATGAGGLDASGIRSAMGLATANLDTQLSTIDTVVDSILLDTIEIGTAGAGLTNINLPNQTMDIIGSITGNLSGSVGSVTGAVGSVTGNVGGNLSGSVGSVTGAVGSVTGAVGSVTGNVGGNVTGSVGSVASGGITAATFAANAITAAKLDPDVTTELQAGLATATNLATVDTVVDAVLAMLDDARTEPTQGAPPANPDMATKVDYLYKLMRNKITQTATTLTVFADDGSTVDHKSTVSDDGTTFTRGEIVSGP